MVTSCRHFSLLTFAPTDYYSTAAGDFVAVALELKVQSLMTLLSRFPFLKIILMRTTRKCFTVLCADMVKRCTCQVVLGGLSFLKPKLALVNNNEPIVKRMCLVMTNRPRGTHCKKKKGEANIFVSTPLSSVFGIAFIGSRNPVNGEHETMFSFACTEIAEQKYNQKPSFFYWKKTCCIRTYFLRCCTAQLERGHREQGHGKNFQASAQCTTPGLHHRLGGKLYKEGKKNNTNACMQLIMTRSSWTVFLGSLLQKPLLPRDCAAVIPQMTFEQNHDLSSSLQLV